MPVRATFKYDVSQLKCPHLGFALGLTFPSRDIVFETTLTSLHHL